MTVVGRPVSGLGRDLMRDSLPDGVCSDIWVRMAPRTASIFVIGNPVPAKTVSTIRAASSAWSMPSSSRQKGSKVAVGHPIQGGRASGVDELAYRDATGHHGYHGS